MSILNEDILDSITEEFDSDLEELSKTLIRDNAYKELGNRLSNQIYLYSRGIRGVLIATKNPSNIEHYDLSEN